MWGPTAYHSHGVENDLFRKKKKKSEKLLYLLWYKSGRFSSLLDNKVKWWPSFVVPQKSPMQPSSIQSKTHFQMKKGICWVGKVSLSVVYFIITESDINLTAENISLLAVFLFFFFMPTREIPKRKKKMDTQYLLIHWSRSSF